MVPSLQTLAFLVLVFGGQANVYLVRERRHFWRSMPSRWVLFATVADLFFVVLLALKGVLMAPVASGVVAALFAAVVGFMVALDLGKVMVFRRQQIATAGPP